MNLIIYSFLPHAREFLACIKPNRATLLHRLAVNMYPKLIEKGI